ncbi:PREDICTED: uncharacterized protein LOC106809162 [Priapulus caudatus]|uniref:Uncharacterized protein LOC106809162 n=1 Tax=Priapulus caudatus TaxID=37621 RepID=A0ABM1E611_PRICU|nr:PREDICTED: uncharacterized protein LOC106809162 [Priapulus caudatus]
MTKLSLSTPGHMHVRQRRSDGCLFLSLQLFLAGLVGLYYCLVEFYVWKGNTRAFVVKCVCVGLSSACVFLCAVACIFPAAHAIDVFHYSTCNATPHAPVAPPAAASWATT